MSSDGAKQPARTPGKRPPLVVFLVLMAGAGLAAGIAYLLNQPANPLPPLADVERIEAHILDAQSAKAVTFQVPPSHWRAIYSAMLPATKDDHAAKWAGPGHLDLKLKNGKSFYIAIFYVSGADQGAFAAGPTFETRIYYRGGNSDELEQAISDALKASRDDHR
jgi:hypothetical protein